MPRLSISSWSLHDQLGEAFYEPVGDDLSTLRNRSDQPAALDLLAVPAAIKGRGIGVLEACHFHLPRVDEAFVADFRGALERAGVDLYSLLIDMGDIASADDEARARDLELIGAWIGVAADLGAACVRVVGGRAEPSPSAIDRAARALLELSARGRERGVRVLTENFQRLTTDTAALVELLDRCGGSVGLCADLGNAEGSAKYQTLATLLPRADSIHAKARETAGGGIDGAELARCLRMAADAGFDGPISVISSGWPGIEAVRDAVAPFTGCMTRHAGRAGGLGRG